MAQIKPHIFFHSDIDSSEEWRAALATQFEEFTFSADTVSTPASVDIALIWKLPDGGLDQFSNLRAILSLGAGIDQLDPERLPKKVPIARLVDTSLTRTMVDYARTAVFRYHRRFHVFERQSRAGNWVFIPATLTDDTSVGILGLGELGQEIALALQHDGFDVRGWSRTPKRLQNVMTYTGRDGLATMVGCSDIVLNVLPLTAETRRILCRDLFTQCRDGCSLINMGRGQHLVEVDLLQAIDSGKIGYATIDVASVEPLPPQHPFWNHPRILITPHVAGTSIPMKAVVKVAENIRRAMAGERLLQQIDLASGY
jgi:glyoxylate/hydroxypyruvate reductase